MSSASIFDELTPAWLKDRFLVGVDLTLDDGTPYPEGVYSQALAGAVSYVEHELGIALDPVKVTREKHDAFELNRGAFWPFRLDFRPVWEVSGFRIKYGSYEPLVLPLSWVHTVNAIHGQVNLIPSEESLGGYLYRSGMPLILGDAFQPLTYVPGYFEFDYTAGFASLAGTTTFASGQATATITLPTEALMPNYEVTLTLGSPANGAVGPVVTNRTRTSFVISMTTPPDSGDATVSWRLSAVPADIKQVIGLKAAALPLDIAGDLLVGAGIASTSVGADGLHMSVNTTSSATNCLTGATKVILADGTTKSMEQLYYLYGEHKDGDVVTREASTFQVKCLDESGNETVGTASNIHITGDFPTMVVGLSNGRSVECTANHPFRMAPVQVGDGSVVTDMYKMASDLQVGDQLAAVYDSDNTNATDHINVYVESLGGHGRANQETVYDMTVATHHNFALAAGVYVHNSGYGARVLQYEKELKALLPALRAKYRAMGVGVI